MTASQIIAIAAAFAVAFWPQIYAAAETAIGWAFSDDGDHPPAKLLLVSAELPVASGMTCRRDCLFPAVAPNSRWLRAPPAGAVAVGAYVLS